MYNTATEYHGTILTLMNEETVSEFAAIRVPDDDVTGSPAHSIIIIIIIKFDDTFMVILICR